MELCDEAETGRAGAAPLDFGFTTLEVSASGATADPVTKISPHWGQRIRDALAPSGRFPFIWQCGQVIVRATGEPPEMFRADALAGR